MIERVSKSFVPKILVIQRVIPDCRKEFFQDLLSLSEENYNLCLISSNQIKDESYQLIDFGRNHKIVGSIYLFGLVHWQNSIKYLLKNDFIILEHALNSISNLINILIAKILRKKICLWGHGRAFHFKENKIKSSLKKFILKMSDHYIGYTEASRKALLEAGYDKEKITIINNSSILSGNNHNLILDKESFEKKLRFAYCARLTKGKDVDILVKAFNIYSKENQSAELHIIGNGPQRGNLESLNQNNPKTFFHGEKFDTSRDEILSQCHFQVIPNHVGLSILQGFSLGLPLITSRSGLHCPEIEYFEENFNGIYYESNENHLLESLRKAGTSFENWNTLSINSTSTAKNYTVEKMVNSFNKALHEFTL